MYNYEIDEIDSLLSKVDTQVDTSINLLERNENECMKALKKLEKVRNKKKGFYLKIDKSKNLGAWIIPVGERSKAILNYSYR